MNGCSDLQVSVAPGVHIDWLVQERRNPSALVMELRLSCTNPSIYLILKHAEVLWIAM